MNAHYVEQLQQLLQRNEQLESGIPSELDALERNTEGLLACSKEFVEVQQAIAEDDTPDAEQTHLTDFIAAAKSCNMQRVKILQKIIAKHTAQKDYTYEDYRADLRELQELIEHRTERAKQSLTISNSDQEKMQKHFTDGLEHEDSVLIKLLIAVSKSDGSVHRKERKFIKKQYKDITLQDPDMKMLDECIEHVPKEVEKLLAQLKDSSEDIQYDIRDMMFSSAVKIALADRKLYEEERTMLIDIARTLNIESERVAAILP